MYGICDSFFPCEHISGSAVVGDEGFEKVSFYGGCREEPAYVGLSELDIDGGSVEVLTVALFELIF